MLALMVLTLVLLSALAAGVLAPHEPTEQFRDAMLQAPSWGANGFWLGTDELGRDILSRMLFGGRLTLGLACGAVLIAGVPGVALGLLAACDPRHLGVLILRVSDVLLALPSVLLAIAVVAVLGPGVLNAMLAVAVSSLPAYVRLVRASALGELARPYVLSARAIGVGTPRLLFRIVLPNCLGPVVVAATLDFSSAVLTIAGLGFLGLGAQPPAPEWGTMLSGARDLVGRAYWVMMAPGVAIITVVMCVNVVGDALRDAMDSRIALPDTRVSK